MSANRCRVLTGEFAGFQGEALHLSRFGSGWVVMLDVHSAHPVYVGAWALDWLDGVGPVTHVQQFTETATGFIRRVNQWCRDSGGIATWEQKGTVMRAFADPDSGKVVRECVVAA
jgi:hypothetical protein